MQELDRLKKELEQNEKDRERIKKEIRIIEEQDDLIDLKERLLARLKEKYHGKFFECAGENMTYSYFHCLQILNNYWGGF